VISIRPARLRNALAAVALFVVAPCAVLAIAVPAAANASTSVRPHSVGSTNYVDNQTPGIDLGVLHTTEGPHMFGNYDALLPPAESTDLYLGWTTTAGWYIGPGYCTEQWRSEDEVNFVRQLPDLGSGQHFIGTHTSYLVTAYHC
jgi:hypothetical protein